MRWLFHRDRLRHPGSLAVVVFVAGAALLLVIPHEASILAVLALFFAYAVVAPFLLALQPHWLTNALMTLVVTPLLMFGLVGVAEWLQARAIGEGGLALLGPLIVSWIGVGLSGVFRLIKFAAHRQTSDNV
jgi:hypothetical protein